MIPGLVGVRPFSGTSRDPSRHHRPRDRDTHRDIVSSTRTPGPTRCPPTHTHTCVCRTAYRSTFSFPPSLLTHTRYYLTSTLVGHPSQGDSRRFSLQFKLVPSQCSTCAKTWSFWSPDGEKWSSGEIRSQRCRHFSPVQGRESPKVTHQLHYLPGVGCATDGTPCPPSLTRPDRGAVSCVPDRNKP